MCGICGKVAFDRDAPVERELIEGMLAEIRHRGPDDEGIYLNSQVGLGHRRLSIIDLQGGHQPLCNEDGTVWVVFNGEIYNYRELRSFLVSKGHVLRTNSDTEVIVHLYEELGQECFSRLRGMFAIGLWDSKRRLLVLARDRVGIKPLYYHLGDSFLSFGSEIKAILADPEVQPEVDPGMIDRFLTFLYMPGDETLLKNIYKLPPGSFLVLKNGKAKIQRYWDLHFDRPANPPSLRAAADTLAELLDETVRLHMISDVPVGFLLSGGVDSTAMLSIAVGKTDQPLSSYTMGFQQPGIADERPYARLASQRFNTEHHEMTITAKDFADFLPKYIWHMEEPVCEPPAIALYYVSKMAREHVKVLISGEGGDEAFAGYPEYRNYSWLETLKRAAGPLSGATQGALALAGRITGSRRLAKYAPLMGVPLESYYYGRTASPFTPFNRDISSLYTPEFLTHVDKARSLEAVTQCFSASSAGELQDKMLYVDTKTWLPDDLLLKADKMTMANSVELRVPLLDHKLLEFAASLPPNYKVRGFDQKHILKRALQGRVPKEILNRKKAGFPVPYQSWLRNELHGTVSDVLNDRTTANRGYFNRAAVQKILRENHKNGLFPKEVFSLLVLEMWHRTFVDDRQRTPQLQSATKMPEGMKIP